jgi:UPF0716 protein FxsA
MFSFRVLFLLFLIVPFVEIYLLIEIGSIIGAPWTIFFVVFTAALGALLVRRQGLSALHRVQSSVNSGGLPAMEMVEGLFLLVAGALLLTPGFFTDAIGFIFLTPPLRRKIAIGIARKGATFAAGRTVNSNYSTTQSRRNSSTIEGEFQRRDDT